MKSKEFIGIQTVRPNDREVTVDDDDGRITCQVCVADDNDHKLGQEELVCAAEGEEEGEEGAEGTEGATEGGEKTAEAAESAE